MEDLGKVPLDQWGNHIRPMTTNYLRMIGQIRGSRHVIFYFSGFLQKPESPSQFTQINHEDLNALMSVMHGMDWRRNLTLLLHTPGGVAEAAETIVDYLRSKFEDIEVIVPTYAMSAGTMISLSADRIVMGRQSQLGPIDPQFIMGQRVQSAHAIVEQFESAKKEILKNSAAAAVWLPLLQAIGPALLQEARNALANGEQMVAQWLEKYMFKNEQYAKLLAEKAASYFNNVSEHKSHGRRIDRDKARAQHLRVEDLEDSQDLQEAVLTAYHLNTISVEKSTSVKIIHSDLDSMFVKNWQPPGPPIQLEVQQTPSNPPPG